ncbi:MAG: substrate-binding domain-containing protein [Victivallaceae bacterium]
MVKFTSKSELIYQDLRRQIAEGSLAPGAMLPTTGELVELYGVAKETINQAMKRLVAEGLVRRLRGVGTAVRGKPEASPDSRDIGFYLPMFGRDCAEPIIAKAPEFADIFAGAATEAAKRGYRLTMIPHLGGTMEENIRHYQVNHIIVHGGDPEVFEQFLLGDLSRKLDYMMINREADFGSINYLEEASVTEIARVLRELAADWGHRRIALIGTDEARFAYSRHIQAHRLVMRELGSYSSALVKRIPEQMTDADFEIAIDELLRLDSAPTLIFVYRTRFLAGTLRALARRQMRIPEDISVVTAENEDIGEFEFDGLPVTSYRFPTKREFGVLAVRHLVDLIEKRAESPVNAVLPLAYREGQTLRPAKPD